MMAWISRAGLALAALVATAAGANAAGLSVELNKTEALDKGCRVFLVIKNDLTSPLESFQLDLIGFDKDGIIGERLGMELAPLAAGKTSVKMFDLATACDGLASILVNEVIACTSAGKAVDGCAAELGLSSKAATELRQ